MFRFNSALTPVLVGAATLAGAGQVLAQPQPAPPMTTPSPAAPAISLPPTGPVAEEAPPIDVPTPAPILVPPIPEKEVAPAPATEKAPSVAKAPEAVVRRTRYDVAILQAIDKITAESLRFAAPVGRPVRYKGLVFTVRACERAAPDEPVNDSIAFVTVESQPRPEPGRPTPAPRQAFRGWMYASSPGLNPMEHAVYDAWLISCRTATAVSAPALPNAAPSTSIAASSARR